MTEFLSILTTVDQGIFTCDGLRSTCSKKVRFFTPGGDGKPARDLSSLRHQKVVYCLPFPRFFPDRSEQATRTYLPLTKPYPLMSSCVFNSYHNYNFFG